MGIFKTKQKPLAAELTTEELKTKYGFTQEQMNVITGIVETLKQKNLPAFNSKPPKAEMVLETLRLNTPNLGQFAKIDILESAKREKVGEEALRMDRIIAIVRTFNELYEPGGAANSLNDSIIPALQKYTRTK